MYAAENYGDQGDLFTGISNGRAVLNRGEKLPLGTYYYVFNYIIAQTNEQRVKKGWIYIQH